MSTCTIYIEHQWIHGHQKIEHHVTMVTIERKQIGTILTVNSQDGVVLVPTPRDLGEGTQGTTTSGADTASDGDDVHTRNSREHLLRNNIICA